MPPAMKARQCCGHCGSSGVLFGCTLAIQAGRVAGLSGQKDAGKASLFAIVLASGEYRGVGKPGCQCRAAL